MKAYPIMFKHPTTGAIIENQGMELRDWFAGLAMQAILGSLEDEFDSDEFDVLAKIFYRMADTMIKARESKDE